MSRFSKQKSTRKTTISTASLPDIVFMMLFFFMVSATIKSEEKIVETKIPQAKELTTAQKKSLIKELHIGKPVNPSAGNTFRIADRERIIPMEQLSYWVNQQRDGLPEHQRDQMIIMLRADRTVDMGLISDIQQKLRKSNARKVLYRSLPDQ